MLLFYLFSESYGRACIPKGTEVLELLPSTVIHTINFNCRGKFFHTIITECDEAYESYKCDAKYVAVLPFQ
jgi:hypothetical protein